MTVALLNTAQFIAFNPETGKPLSAGSLYLYEPGTTTARDAWHEKGKANLHENPITLGVLGDAVIYLDGVYDLVVKNAAGEIVQTLEDVSGTVDGADVQILVDEAVKASSIGYGVKEVLLDTSLSTSATGVLHVVDATAGNVTVVLPAATTMVNHAPIQILRIDGSANTVTIEGDGSDQINGALTYVIAAQWAGVHVRSSGSEWFIESKVV